jgi:HPt (histidine-containing phosphotransfer) domain-containing protein
MNGELTHSNDIKCRGMTSRSPAGDRCALAEAYDKASSIANALGVEKPLDREELVRRCLGRIELAERLLKSFESRFPEDLSRIEECLLAGDSTELTRLVHQLKGSAANVSAPELHMVMTRMEQAVRGQQHEAAHICLAEVHRAWDRYLDFQNTQDQTSMTNSGSAS